MNEHLFFESNDDQLFGVLFEQAKALKICTICIHPFAEEKKSCQKILTDIARSIADSGQGAFLFDLYGCGDSQGSFTNASLSRWIDDTRQAITFIRQRMPAIKINLLGLRLGAFLAIVCAQLESKIDTLILIEPVLAPKKYLHRSLRQKLIKELHTDGKVASSRKSLVKDFEQDRTVDFDGYEISSHFYHDLNTYTISPEKLPKTVLLQISLKSKISTEYQNFISSFPDSGMIAFKLIHLPPFWQRLETPDYTSLLAEIKDIVKISTST